MYPLELPATKHFKGDDWEGLEFGPIIINEAVPENTLASCALEFKDADGVIGYRLSSDPQAGEGSLVIDDAVIWEITAPVQLLNLDTGDWNWYFSTIDSANVKRTLYKSILAIKDK